MNRHMNTECSDISTRLESWYARDNGRYLLACTQAACREFLDTSFGYHILQLGITREQPLFDSSRINHRIYCAARPGQGIGLVADAAELPFDGDSIDIVIAHHSLEFTANPHQVLREIQRVLTPQGHLLVVGFNPHSLMGANLYLRGLSRQSLWRRHSPVSEKRLTDWLRLLGCDVQCARRCYAVPPFGGRKLRQWLLGCDAWSNRHNLPGGGIYIVHAIKQVGALHKPRLQFLRRQRLMGLAVPKPAAAPSPTPATAARRGRAMVNSDAGNAAA